MSRPLSVVLAGGGTAGHVEPALAVADALRREDGGTVITLLGTARGLETRLVPARGYELALIPPVPLPRRPTVELLAVPGRLAGSVRAARAVLDRVAADVVVGFGGYVSLPAYLAARSRRTPVVVHEANARPGLANRVGARLTRHVAVAVPGTGLRHALVVGIPLRPSIAGLDRAASRVDACLAFGLDPDGRTLLVVGGSQGARRLNTVAVAAARDLAAAGVQVLHAAGAAHADTVRTGLAAALGGPLDGRTPAWTVLPYLDRMDLAYAAADVALCRAGALTCAELTAVGLPAAYVPLPVGNGEQRLNAVPVVAAGGGLEVADEALNRNWVVESLLPLLADPVRLAAMGRSAARSGHRDADVALARLVRDAAGRSA